MASSCHGKRLMNNRRTWKLDEIGSVWLSSLFCRFWNYWTICGCLFACQRHQKHHTLLGPAFPSSGPFGHAGGCPKMQRCQWSRTSGTVTVEFFTELWPRNVQKTPVLFLNMLLLSDLVLFFCFIFILKCLKTCTWIVALLIFHWKSNTSLEKILAKLTIFLLCCHLDPPFPTSQDGTSGGSVLYWM